MIIDSEDSATVRLRMCLSKVENALRDDLCDALLLSHRHEHNNHDNRQVAKSRDRKLLLPKNGDHEDFTEEDLCSISSELKHLDQWEVTMREELKQAENAWQNAHAIPQFITTSTMPNPEENDDDDDFDESKKSHHGIPNLAMTISCDDSETAMASDTDVQSEWSFASTFLTAKSSTDDQSVSAVSAYVNAAAAAVARRNGALVARSSNGNQSIINIDARLAAAVHEAAHGGQFGLTMVSDLMLAQLYQHQIMHRLSFPRPTAGPSLSPCTAPNGTSALLQGGLNSMMSANSSLLSNWLSKRFNSLQQQQMRYYGKSDSVHFRWIGSTPMLGSAANNGEIVLLTGGGDDSDVEDDDDVSALFQIRPASRTSCQDQEEDVDLEEID